MKLKIILTFLLFTAFAYSQNNGAQKNNTSCSNLIFKDYYYHDKNTFKNGSIKLFSYKNGKRFDALNKLILKNSEYILELNFNNATMMFQKSDSVFDHSEDNKKFQNWVDHLDLSKIFTLNSESESYQKLSEEMNSVESETISTSVLYLDKILVYSVDLNDIGDKESTDVEYLNIDLNKMELINFNSLITVNQLNAFNNIILNYANNHKKEIIKNYKEKMSNSIGDVLSHYMLAFEQPSYNYSKIKCKIDSKDFYHFSSNGIAFKVNVTDKNLNMNEEREQIGTYISEITIPYKEIINYLDQKNSLYSKKNNNEN